MKIETLSGAWEFRQAGSGEWLPASVPGGVHTDLLALGRIPDPFVADNERRLQWVVEIDWIYMRKFVPSPELLSEDKIFLVCDGLDTLAEVSLNGHELGRTNNMFRRYEWEVKSFLNDGTNELAITFLSPVRFIAEQQALRPLPGVPQAIPGGPHLRKAPCQFGWDWGPQLPPIGIWKEIRLEGCSTARISDCHVRQNHAGGSVTVSARLAVQRWTEARLAGVVRITAPDGEILEGEALIQEDQAAVTITIPDPQLWWPNGYGDQPLYQVQVSLLPADPAGADPLDLRQLQIGLRTVELRQEPDQWGRSFVIVVNGVAILCKGANWIPADSFPTRITTERLEDLLRSALQSHQNMLRVWGGGFYEEERFYDLCDRYGILVWQEFAFSCSGYPLDDPDFVENVMVEALQNIRRLRHRASLALWCGNNEIEWLWVKDEWNRDHPGLKDLMAAYDRFFHQTLPAWCQAEDPDHPYWPSSPSSGKMFSDPNSQRQGDTHFWDVWHEKKPFTDYRGVLPRFMSEFGFQALPPLDTIRAFASEDDWNMTSYVMEQHQKHASGNSLIVGQMLDSFRLPRDFPALVYLSMALQAEGIRYGVEHWRRHPERVAGILYWQLNDCWPVASWSSLDYFGRWKALQYAARRFFSPLLLSIEDAPPRQAVYVSNDGLVPRQGMVNWSLETLEGEVVHSGQSPVQVAPQAAVQVCQLDFTAWLDYDSTRHLLFIAELWQAERMISRQTAFFAPIKHLALADPQITASLSLQEGQLLIDLESKSLALLVELSLSGADVLFSDNYFNLPAWRTIRISCPLPAGWTLARAQNELQIFTVYDSFTPKKD